MRIQSSLKLKLLHLKHTRKNEGIIQIPSILQYAQEADDDIIIRKPKTINTYLKER